MKNSSILSHDSGLLNALLLSKQGVGAHFFIADS